MGPIIPGRGLRQGDPLSPYLYLLYTEGLSALIKDTKNRGCLHGCKIARGAPIVSNLLFANDSFFFVRADIEECRVLKNIFTTYECASGQAINYYKSGVFFSSNVDSDLREGICNVVGIFSPLNTGRYLGLPSLIGRSKKQVFSILKDKMWTRIQTWLNKPHSKAEREILIKCAAQALPVYYMSVFMLPVSITDELQKMLNSFWWRTKKDGSRGINWLSCDKFYVSKRDGGMGFRDFHNFNLEMLGK